MSLVDLSQYDNSWYRPGGSFARRALWAVIGQPLFATPLLPSSGLRVALLRLFGARIGQGVVIKPHVQVKYPWHLVVGDHCWIGEHAWIDNLTTVRVAGHVCISQGAYLCTGNHDWSDPCFGLIIAPIQLGEGSWAGAKCILLPGATLGKYAVAASGSVIAGSVPDFQIFAGNPARLVKTRSIRERAAQAAGDTDGNIQVRRENVEEVVPS